MRSKQISENGCKKLTFLEFYYQSRKMYKLNWKKLVDSNHF